MNGTCYCYLPLIFLDSDKCCFDSEERGSGFGGGAIPGLCIRAAAMDATEGGEEGDGLGEREVEERGLGLGDRSCLCSRKNEEVNSNKVTGE